MTRGEGRPVVREAQHRKRHNARSSAYISQWGLEGGVVAAEDLVEHVVPFELGADAQRRLEHARVRVPALTVEPVLVTHRLQLLTSIKKNIYKTKRRVCQK